MVNLGRICLLISVLLLGCMEDREVWEGRISEVDGVVRVENPPVPLATPGVISAQMLWSSAGPSEGDIWEAPNWIHAHGDVLYVVDRMASKIHRLTLDGESMSALGEPGEGPGEYGRIIDAIPTPAGLFVVDGGNGRVEVLDARGEILASSPLGQFVFVAIPMGEDAIAVSGMLGGDPRWERIDAVGTVEPLSFPEFVDPREPGEIPSRAWTFMGNPVRLRFTSPQIQFFSASGDLQRVIDLPIPPEEATDEEVEALVTEMASVLSASGVPSSRIQQQADLVRSRPRAKYRFRDIRFDRKTGLLAIWEQNPEDFGSGPASLHLLSSDGIYLGSLDFDRAWSAFDLEGDVVYALSRDSTTDLGTLEAFLLSVPAELREKAGDLASGRNQ